MLRHTFSWAARWAAVAALACAVRPLAAQPAVKATRVADTHGADTHGADPHAVDARTPAAKRAPTPPRAAPTTVTIEREVFAYAGAGRRDPFASLMTTTQLRPTLPELRLVAVAYDPTNGGSVAILRELATKTQYRVRVGTLLGRMRVAGIGPKNVVFNIEELGYSRQETLGLNDSTAVRSR